MYLTQSRCLVNIRPLPILGNKQTKRTNGGMNEDKTVMQGLPCLPRPEAKKGHGEGHWPRPGGGGWLPPPCSGRGLLSQPFSGKAGPATTFLHLAPTLGHAA